MEDISSRAKTVLASVGQIAAEDTRRTGMLLKRLGIKAIMVSYHEHNEAARTAQLMEVLRGGIDIALVTDAGTPAISDPGYRLVKAAADEGLTVSPVPGPSAVTAALSASGLPTDRFLFEGFLPRKKGRQTRLRSLAEFEGTVILFESPLRLAATLRDVREHFGGTGKYTIFRALDIHF
ncbi:MAG: 16S rRNA (cytidine(1402)-2'-O)-methyltransferase [Candidatus Marinimicrobia bacterium]|nr:16S rRNA (cytidine(1402)-2'-O)-methyltransferase [Candidatus Neomarinimicrobiota bacterium]